MDQQFETVKENDVFVLQLGIGLLPPFFEFKETLNRTIEKKNLHGIDGLNFATTNIMTLFDTKKPLDFFMPKQRIGLSYSKKFKNEVELTFGGNLLAERTVIVPFMLKYKRYGIGGEMRLDLTDPMKFVESGFYFVCKIPTGKIDLVIKLNVGVSGINKVIVQLRRTLGKHTLNLPSFGQHFCIESKKFKKVPVCIMFLTISPEEIIEDKMFYEYLLIEDHNKEHCFREILERIYDSSNEFRRSVRENLIGLLSIVLCRSSSRELDQLE